MPCEETTQTTLEAGRFEAVLIVLTNWGARRALGVWEGERDPNGIGGRATFPQVRLRR